LNTESNGFPQSWKVSFFGGGFCGCGVVMWAGLPAPRNQLKSKLAGLEAPPTKTVVGKGVKRVKQTGAAWLRPFAFCLTAVIPAQCRVP
jgi:hypothetical protein